MSWDFKGNAIDLGMSTLYAVNRTGTVAGIAGYPWELPLRAATWDRGGHISFLTAPVGPSNLAASINDNGTVCGSSSNSDGTGTRAVIWEEIPTR